MNAATWRGNLRDRLGARIGLSPERAWCWRRAEAAFATWAASAPQQRWPQLVAELLARPDDDPTLRALIAHATVNETWFYRDPQQLEALLAWARVRHAEIRRPLRLWSAGCATGAEPYSLAMALTAAGIPARILGTDLSEPALAVARDGGPYPRHRVALLPAELQRRFLVPSGVAVRLHPALRDTVAFRSHNLAADPLPQPPGGWDAILCRNVFIYFTVAQARATAQRMQAALAPGGRLVLGAADRVIGLVSTPPLGRPPAAYAPAEGRAGAPLPAPPRRATASVEDVRRALRAGALGAAEHGAAALLAGADPAPDAWLLSGVVHLARHRFADAEAEAERAGRAGAGAFDVELLGAMAAERLDRPHVALRRLERATAIRPSAWAPRLRRALRLRRAGRLLPAEAELQRVAALLDEGADPFAGASDLSAVEGHHLDTEAATQLVATILDELGDLTGNPTTLGRPS